MHSPCFKLHIFMAKLLTDQEFHRFNELQQKQTAFTISSDEADELRDIVARAQQRRDDRAQAMQTIESHIRTFSITPDELFSPQQIAEAARAFGLIPLAKKPRKGTDAKPAEPKASAVAPANSVTAPTGPVAAPADSVATPTGSVAAPASSVATSAGSVVTPAGSVSTPTLAVDTSRKAKLPGAGMDAHMAADHADSDPAPAPSAETAPLAAVQAGTEARASAETGTEVRTEPA
ncbi:hypothetical protein B0O95_105216 [Mycetohabitans endofungorum]|uniref:Uncharacterized protein n=1 Tax=Mycetohabitans endofungorum TaxID=417203 RepID=A0A2P5KBD2_9BURK|nr:hypothetical protein B0O95_105216 [Mycetohabitans endofungorum]